MTPSTSKIRMVCPKNGDLVWVLGIVPRGWETTNLYSLLMNTAVLFEKDYANLSLLVSNTLETPKVDKNASSEEQEIVSFTLDASLNQ